MVCLLQKMLCYNGRYEAWFVHLKLPKTYLFMSEIQNFGTNFLSIQAEHFETKN